MVILGLWKASLGEAELWKDQEKYRYKRFTTLDVADRGKIVSPDLLIVGQQQDELPPKFSLPQVT